MIPRFYQTVYKALKKVPKGRVTTYKELAKAVNNPRAARAVGNAMNKNPFAPEVPCHRVVRSDGSMGGFGEGAEKKKYLLKKEGILVKGGKIVRFSRKFFKFS